MTNKKIQYRLRLAILMLSSVAVFISGCAPTVQETPDARIHSLDQAGAGRVEPMVSPLGNKTVSIRITEVAVSAVVPGRPSLYREALSQSVVSALSTCRGVKVVSEHVASDIQVDVKLTLTQFKSVVGGRKNASYSFYGPADLNERKSSDEWVAECSVAGESFRSGRESLFFSFDASEKGRTTVDSSDKNILDLRLAQRKEQETSHAVVIQKLGRKIAQQIVSQVAD